MYLYFNLYELLELTNPIYLYINIYCQVSGPRRLNMTDRKKKNIIGPLIIYII